MNLIRKAIDSIYIRDPDRALVYTEILETLAKIEGVQKLHDDRLRNQSIAIWKLRTETLKEIKAEIKGLELPKPPTDDGQTLPSLWKKVVVAVALVVATLLQVKDTFLVLNG